MQRYSSTHSHPCNGVQWSISRPDRYTPGKKILMPIEQEAGWAQEPIEAFQRREKSLALTDIRTPDRPTRSLVTIPNTLPRLPANMQKTYLGLCIHYVFLLSLFTDSLQYPMDRGLGGPHKGSERFGETKNLLPLPRFESQKLVTVMSAIMIHLMTTSSDVIFCSILRCTQKYTVVLMA